jgi:hypothetical protein
MPPLSKQRRYDAFRAEVRNSHEEVAISQRKMSATLHVDLYKTPHAGVKSGDGGRDEVPELRPADSCAWAWR